MRIRSSRRLVTIAAALVLFTAPGAAQNVAVEEHVLSNGMKLLLLPRKGDPNVAAGWVAKVGSVNERPGITGIAHLFEHMMFKGTRVIGTRDIRRNLEVMAEMDRVKEEMAREARPLERLERLGELPDPPPPDRIPEHLKELQERFAKLGAEEKDLLVKNEFDKIYTGAGASAMNAGTTNDFTIYFINVPANKLELWFWMESDRLMNPVFREFYSERDVVREERRLRTESTPTGRFEEQFDAMYWQSSPYSWPVIGWPSDIEQVTREEALSFFSVYYAPNNIAACLVGDFDPATALELAKKYFERLPHGPRDPTPIRTREVKQLAEKRMLASAETKPEVRIRYHTVPDGHVDDYALNLLGDILSGRTGRLYKALVLEKQVANEASARQSSLKYEGTFELSGVAKPGKTPEDVEQSLLQELERMKTDLVPERELRKVKNQAAAGDFRRLRSSFGLMIRILFNEAYRGWQSINTDPAKVEAVTAEDIRRVARTYFVRENENVIVYTPKEAAPGAAPDPILDALSDEERAQVKQFEAMVSKAEPDRLSKMLEQIRSQAGSVPEDKKGLMRALERAVERAMEERGKKPPAEGAPKAQ